MSRQNKFTSAPFSTLIACANEAAVTDYCNYMTDKTQQNKRFLQFLVQQKVPRGKLSFFAYVISEERGAIRPKQLRNDAFHVKTSQSAKNQLDRAKNENRPKTDICPFSHEALQLLLRLPQKIPGLKMRTGFFSCCKSPSDIICTCRRYEYIP